MYPMTPDPDSIFAPSAGVELSVAFPRALKLFTRAIPPLAGWALVLAGLNWLITVVTGGLATLLVVMMLVPTQLGLYRVAWSVARGEVVTLGSAAWGLTRGQSYLVGLIWLVSIIGGLLCLGVGVFVPLAFFPYVLAAMARDDLEAGEAMRAGWGFFRSNFGSSVLVLILTLILESLGQATWALNAVLLPLAVCFHVACYEMGRTRD